MMMKMYMLMRLIVMMMKSMLIQQMSMTIIIHPAYVDSVDLLLGLDTIPQFSRITTIMIDTLLFILQM
jgi:hypothetical protein